MKEAGKTREKKLNTPGLGLAFFQRHERLGEKGKATKEKISWRTRSGRVWDRNVQSAESSD